MRIRWLPIFLAVCLALAGPVSAQPDEVLATVNGEAVHRSEFGWALVESVGRAALDAYVDRVLIEQEARRRGVAAAEQELAARKALEVEIGMSAAAANARMTPEEFAAAAQEHGWRMDELRRGLAEGISPDGLRARLLVERIVEPELDLSEPALRAYYERTRGRRFAAAHILVSSRRRAEELLGALAQDLSLWPRLVAEASLDRASVPYRGRLPLVPAGSALGRVLSGMKPDELALYRGSGGWHVVRHLCEAGGPPFEEVRERLREELVVQEAKVRTEPLLALLNSQARVVAPSLPGPDARGLASETAAVYVNDEAVPVSRFADALVREFGRATLRGYIQRLLIAQEAKRRGMAVSEDALAERLDRVADQLVGEQAMQRGMTRTEFEDLLAAAGLDVGSYRRDLCRRQVSLEDVRATLLAEALVAEGVDVSEAEIAEAYAALGQERLVVTELVADEPAAAERLRVQVQNGAAFGMVAGTSGLAPDAWLEGGLVGTVGPADAAYPYVKDLRPGDVSRVFRDGAQYRIMKVLRRVPPCEPPALDSVRASLAEEVRARKSQARVRALLTKLEAEAAVDISWD